MQKLAFCCILLGQPKPPFQFPLTSHGVRAVVGSSSRGKFQWILCTQQLLKSESLVCNDNNTRKRESSVNREGLDHS